MYIHVTIYVFVILSFLSDRMVKRVTQAIKQKVLFIVCSIDIIYHLSLLMTFIHDGHFGCQTSLLLFLPIFNMYMYINIRSKREISSVLIITMEHLVSVLVSNTLQSGPNLSLFYSIFYRPLIPMEKMNEEKRHFCTEKRSYGFYNEFLLFKHTTIY
jgi:hypothetical protein